MQGFRPLPPPSSPGCTSDRSSGGGALCSGNPDLFGVKCGTTFSLTSLSLSKAVLTVTPSILELSPLLPSYLPGCSLFPSPHRMLGCVWVCSQPPACLKQSSAGELPEPPSSLPSSTCGS